MQKLQEKTTYKKHSKDELEEMLETSQDDYRDYKDTAKISKLRDASNKLVAIAEGLASNKEGKEVKTYGEFQHTFNKHYENADLTANLDTLHVFFYSGLGYEQSAQSIEYLYNKSKKEIRNLVEQENE